MAMHQVLGMMERNPEAVEEAKKKWPRKLIPKQNKRAEEKMFMTWLIPKD